MDERHYRVPPDRRSARRSQTGTQNPSASCPFHLDWGALVQAVLHRPLSLVPKPFRGPICISRIARGSMWKSFWRTISSAQGPFSRILLTHDEEGCGSLRQKMRQMSTTCPHTIYAIGDAETNFRSLTLRAVGYGQSRTLTSCTRPKEIPARCHRLLQ